MADQNSLIPKTIRPRTADPSDVELTEQVWPEGSLQGLMPTQYPDLKTNPSLDTRTLMGNVEQIARRHWWSKVNNDHGPDNTNN